MMSDTSPFGNPEEDDDDVFEADDTDDEGSGFRYPAGIYKIRVIDLEKEESKAGNPMWTWSVLLVQGHEDGIGNEMKMWTALTPKARWKLNEVIKALKLPTKDGKLRARKSDIVGKECLAEVEDSEYNGRAGSSIGSTYPLDTDEVKLEGTVLK